MVKGSAFYTNNYILSAIGAFKLFKAAVLIVTGITILSYLHGNIKVMEEFSDLLNLAPAHRILHKFLINLSLIDDKTFRNISIGSFIYAGFFLVEGVGLLMKKRWAEYFTIIITASFIPLEVYELIRKISLVKSLVIVVNGLIIVYLIKRLKFEK